MVDVTDAAAARAIVVAAGRIAARDAVVDAAPVRAFVAERETVAVRVGVAAVRVVVRAETAVRGVAAADGADVVARGKTLAVVRADVAELFVASARDASTTVAPFRVAVFVRSRTADAFFVAVALVVREITD